MPGSFDALLENALRLGAEFQTWPGHFLFKRVETEILLAQTAIPQDATVLELGCGNGFQSLLLASRCRHVVATDLFAPNPHTHSVGLDKAESLLKHCGVDNVTLLSCAAEAMPFPDEQFDVVFSSSVMEHVAPRRQALAEIYRVLKPGGQMIMAVPTHVASLCTFPHQMLYVGIRAAQVLTRKVGRSAAVAEERVPSARQIKEQDGSRSLRDTWRSFWRNHPSFPWPEPHGTYESIFEELAAQFPSRWRAMIEESGFQTDRCFALTLVPISLLEVFSPTWMARIYDWSKGLHLRVTANPLACSLTYIWATVAHKPPLAAAAHSILEEVHAGTG